jgi:putative endonuclease
MNHRVNQWFVYLLECSDGTFYCGITTDIKRRVYEHNNTKTGAKYTRGRRPTVLMGYVSCDDRSSALIEEARIKKLTRREKAEFISLINI